MKLTKTATRWRAGALCATLALFGSGCGSDAARAEDESCTVDETYDPNVVAADFSADVDNPLFPLPVGRTWTYREGIQDVVVTVLAERKEVMGVTCTVVRDTVSSNGVTLEDTWDWYAQHVDGSVWYFGEDTTEFANGEPVSKEGSWESGVGGAKPGMIIPPNPTIGTKYRQEYLPCEAEDYGEVIALDATATVPTGSYTGCLKTHDSTPLDPEVNEQKTYCPDVGLVLATDVNTGESEELQQVSGP